MDVEDYRELMDLMEMPTDERTTEQNFRFFDIIKKWNLYPRNKHASAMLESAKKRLNQETSK